MSARTSLDERLKRVQLAILSAIMISLTGGCADWIPVETPPNLALRCPDADTDPTQTVSFRRDIFEAVIRSVQPAAPNCSCHLSDSGIRIGIELAGLRLDSHTTLRAGGNNTRRNIVVPGQPCASALYLKLTASPPIGSRMPLSGRFLTNQQLQLVHDWIAEGANDN